MTEEALEKRRAYYRQYMKAHPELRRAWREKNREHVNEYSRSWNAAHPEQRKEYIRRYWERKTLCSDESSDERTEE